MANSASVALLAYILKNNCKKFRFLVALYLKLVVSLSKIRTTNNNIMNKKVILVLAKQRVKFEAKYGEGISLEEAIELETAKLSKLSRENDFNY